MQILNYIKSLLPKFTKSRVLEDSRITGNELKEIALGSYQEANKGLEKWQFKSQQMIEFTTIYARNLKPDRGDNIITSIYKNLEKVLKTHAKLNDLLEKHLDEDIITNSASALKTNLIRSLEVISFISKFSIIFLNHAYVFETAQLFPDANRYIKDNLSPAELAYVEQHFVEFCIALRIFSKSVNEVDKLLEDIPDIAITAENGDSVVATLGHDKMDPLGMRNFSGATMNPIYHVGLMIAEWQANRYKHRKELKKVLELRLLNLQMLKDKTPDAKLEQEIEYIQSRVQGLEYKIKKSEENA